MSIQVVSHTRGWLLVDGHALAPGDPMYTHLVAEGLYP